MLPMSGITDKFKTYFSLSEIQLDKKVIIIYISAAVLLVFGEYYDSTTEINSLLTTIAGHHFAEKYAQFLLFDNDYSFQQLINWGINCVLVFLLVPVFIVKIILKENLADYGFNFKGISKHFWIYSLLLAIMIPVVLVVSKSPAFLNKYPFYHIRSKEQLPRFFIWECIYILQFISIEFFFRGFLLHGVKHKFGYYAVLFAILPYCMIHFGKPMPETLAAIIAGAVLGFLSINTGSILLGIFIHVSVAMLMDVCALWRSGFFNYL